MELKTWFKIHENHFQIQIAKESSRDKE